MKLNTELMLLTPQVDTTGLVAHYKLDHSAFDYSLNGNDGTLSGANIAPAYPGYDFNGAGDYIGCGNDATLQITAALTVSVWFKTSSSDSQYIVAKDDATNRDWILFKPGTDVVQFIIFISNVAKTVASTDTTWADGSWHHLVGVNDGSDLYLYTDGVLNKKDTGDGGTIDNDAADVEIGRQGDGSDYANGNIGDVMIFNVAKSAQEVKSIYEQLRGRYSE